MHGKTFEKLIFLDFLQKIRLENIAAIAMVQSGFRISIWGLNTLIYTVKTMVEKSMNNLVGISSLAMSVASFALNISMFNKWV